MMRSESDPQGAHEADTAEVEEGEVIEEETPRNHSHPQYAGKRPPQYAGKKLTTSQRRDIALGEPLHDDTTNNSTTTRPVNHDSSEDSQVMETTLRPKFTVEPSSSSESEYDTESSIASSAAPEQVFQYRVNASYAGFQDVDPTTT